MPNLHNREIWTPRSSVGFRREESFADIEQSRKLIDVGNEPSFDEVV